MTETNGIHIDSVEVLALRVYRLRRRGVTQARIADMAGLSAPQVSQLLRGHRVVAGRVAAISEVVGVLETEAGEEAEMEHGYFPL